jgi:hypothetical protein
MGEFKAPRARVTRDRPSRGELVPAYRLYRLDGAGRIVSAEWIEAAAEQPAIDQACNRLPEGGFELWHGQRLVYRGPRSEP